MSGTLWTSDSLLEECKLGTMCHTKNTQQYGLHQLALHRVKKKYDVGAEGENRTRTSEETGF